MKRLLACVVIMVLGAGSGAAAPVEPAKYDFNWPDPPREGAKDFFVITHDGQPRCVIVKPKDAGPGTKAAADGLETYLRLVTGAKFKIIDDTQTVPAEMNAIHVGDTTVARTVELNLPEVRYGSHVYPNINGFLVTTRDAKTLVIRGGSDEAVQHGVVSLLRRYVGVMQYWIAGPGSIGDVIPRRATLAIPQVEWRDWPYWFSRAVTRQPFGIRRAGMLDFSRQQQTLRCGENYAEWLAPSKYAKDHPEWFPLVGGRRLIPTTDEHKGWQPCVSNPEVVRVMAANVIEYFRGHPGSVGINFAINDGGGDCDCDNCIAMDAIDAHGHRCMTDRYVKFTNQVAAIVKREFPTKKLIAQAYGNARQAPLTVAYDPMVIPVLTYSDTSEFRAWDEWVKTGSPEMGTYLHHDDTFMFVLPPLDIHHTARKIFYTGASGRGRVFYMEAHPLWPLSGVISYVTCELLWDPRRDVDALLAEYHAEFFGPAAKPMREFTATLEAGYERWRQTEGEDHPYGKDVRTTRYNSSAEQFKLLTTEEAARAMATLDEAARLAKDDAKVAERVRVIRWMFGLIQLGVEQHWAGVSLEKSPAATEADARAAVDGAKKIVSLSRAAGDYISNTLEKPPADAYPLYVKPGPVTHPNLLYAKMKTGLPSPQSMAAMTAALDRAADATRRIMGDRAGAWWQQQRDSVTDPLLAAAFESAQLRASGVQIVNLVDDPGFEKLGEKTGPVDETRQQAMGFHFWNPERSPYRISVTDEEAHGGRVSLMIDQVYRMRFSRSARVQPGDRVRLSFWLKHNDGAGRYRVEIEAAGKAERTKLATIPVANRPGEWQELRADVTVPAGAASVQINLFVDRQAAGATCWVDDFFIGKYPTPGSAR